MSTAIELRPAAALPGRVGQATAIEQSRAIAEVQAQVIVAQQMPRDIDRAVREMKRSCGRTALAEKAFYRYPRAGSQVSGESIVLAKELARCWGNLDYGIAELRRDDVAGESEMMAFAWDLETNTRPRTTFIVPHVRDRSASKGGPERLTDVRDVYENNANMGARRVREMIFNVLPPWFIEDAKAACYATLANDDSDGATLAERAATAAARFGNIGVRREQLVQKLGAPIDRWSAADLAQLAVIYRSIERGETTEEDEFGTTSGRVTPEDIAGQAPPAQPAQQRRRGRAAAPDASPADAPASPAQAPSAPPSEPSAGEARTAMATGGQVGMIQTEFERLGYDLTSADDERAVLRRAARLAGAGEVTALNQLPQEGAKQALDALKKCSDIVELDELLESGEAPDA